LAVVVGASSASLFAARAEAANPGPATAAAGSALSVTAYVERYGRSPNYIATLFTQGYGTPGAGTVAPWTLVDFSVRYHPIAGLEVSMALNNAFNRMPPTDNSYYGNLSMPYNEFNYNVYGRQCYLSATYKMGQ
jgi:outer membrane receptor protein involved in Fe transport